MREPLRQFWAPVWKVIGPYPSLCTERLIEPQPNRFVSTQRVHTRSPLVHRYYTKLESFLPGSKKKSDDGKPKAPSCADVVDVTLRSPFFDLPSDAKISKKRAGTQR